jgi:hypothetical protein
MKLQFLAVAARASAASAQQQDPVQDIVLKRPPTYAGSYDMITHKLTPPSGALQALAPDVIYDNTCLDPALFTFTPLAANQSRIDDGRIPSTSSPVPAVGAVNKHRVTQISVGYGTTVPGTALGGPGASLTVTIWQFYQDCSAVVGSGGVAASNALGAPVAIFNITGLPGTTVAGQAQGFLVDLPLAPANQFDIFCDAEGTNNGSAMTDKFGYGYSVPTPAVAGTSTGPFRAGTSTTGTAPCAAGIGTYYNTPGVTVDGTGLDNINTYTNDAGGVTTCFVMTPTASGLQYLGYWFELSGDFNDCDANGISDASDIAAGAPDLNTNGIPDSCETPQPFNYCTAGTTTNGCLATMSATGTPSAAALSGFTLTCSQSEGQKQGIIFYGNLGQAAAPWINGLGQGNSFLCVKAPTQRTGAATMSGTLNACDGSMSIDFLAYAAANPGAVGTPLAAGQTYDAQCWFRDPPSPAAQSGVNQT